MPRVRRHGDILPRASPCKSLRRTTLRCSGCPGGTFIVSFRHKNLVSVALVGDIYRLPLFQAVADAISSSQPGASVPRRFSPAKSAHNLVGDVRPSSRRAARMRCQSPNAGESTAQAHQRSRVGRYLAATSSGMALSPAIAAARYQ